MSNLRIAGVIKESVVDGTGLRFTLFTQGCPHHCPGCHNPETHSPTGGTQTNISRILEEIDKNPLLQGVTFSGGEPFVQAAALLHLAQEIKARGLDLWCYSGYTWEELLQMAAKDEAVSHLLELVDVLVDGLYLQEQRDYSLAFRGSRNQRILDVAASLERGRPMELMFAER